LMQDAIERFGRTIGHLTDISRLQQVHAQPATQVRLAHVVRDVQLDLTLLLVQTEGQVQVAIPEECTLLFSEKNLRSVVYNLLSNALKYRHPDRTPVVQVTYRAEAKYQVLEVQDNGLGLDLKQGQEKLFAMFQRLHTHVEGSGVGLYMVKKMVENAGGYIEVRSEPNQGATFSVYFPR
jgi:signal transduction histidine kinase